MEKYDFVELEHKKMRNDYKNIFFRTCTARIGLQFGNW